MNIYQLLFILLIVAPIGTLIHESGHLIGAKIVKADNIKLTIGSGKRIIIFSFKNIEFNIHTFFFIGGHLQNKRNTPYKLSEMITIISLGPILNGIFALLFYFLYNVLLSNYIYILYLFNLWLALVNIIPFKIKGKQSDGYTILNLLHQRKHNI